jgi:FHS family glucose/mannose:H+ symporter-like MFS transporter
LEDRRIFSHGGELGMSLSKGRVVIALIATYALYAVLLNSVGTVILQSIRSFGVGKPEASVLEACKDLSIAAVSFLLASFLPRIGYRRALIVGLLALAVACAAMPLLRSFWMTAVSFAVTGATVGLAKVAVYGAIGLVSPDPKRHASLTALIEGLFMAGVLGGYWLFSAFIDPNAEASLSWLNVYWVLAAACVGVAAIWAASPLDEAPLRSRGEPGAAASFLVMMGLLRQPLVGVFLLATFLYVLIEQSLGTWMPTFNHEVLRLPSQLSVQLASVYAGSLCAGRLSASGILRRFSPFVVLSVCVVVMGGLIVTALLATRGFRPPTIAGGWRELPLQALILPLIGFAMSPIYPTLNSVMLSALPVGRQAGMTGLIVVFSALGGTLGSFLTGKAFSLLGGRAAIAGSLLPMIVLFALLLVMRRLIARGPAAP